jgi:arabinofuranan 3-O-arabinosyltransferase
MTTRAVDDRDLDTAERPGARARVGDRLRKPRTWLWVALVVGLFVAPFLSQPGRYVADTRDALWFSPWSYNESSLTLWQQSPHLGREQRDAIVVPMGLTVGALRSLGLPLWAAERAWHGLLLVVAAAGMVLFVDELRRRKTTVAPFTAALIYVTTPYVFAYGLGTTGAFLPYVLLPMLLFTALRGVHRGGPAWPALFALTLFLMGGGNGAPQAYALFIAVVFLAWVVFVERSVPFREAAIFTGIALGLSAGLAVYWVALIPGSVEVGNALAYSEQPRVINAVSSYSESIRGLGFWTYYGGDGFGSWTPTVRRYVTEPVFVLTGFLIPLGALAAAAVMRWRTRLFFVLLVIGAVVVMAGIFPVDRPSPFGRFLLFSYDHVPGAAGLRTTYKVGSALTLALAVLFGVGLEAAAVRLREVGRGNLDRVLVRGAVLVLLLNAIPLWSGGLYDVGRTAAPLPAYWRLALDELADRNTSTRAFFAPGALVSSYRWGTFREGLPEAYPGLPSVHRAAIPIGTRYGSNLLAAIEAAYQDGVVPRGMAAVMRLLGVRDVVLQNDLDWQRSRSARPAHVQVLSQDPSLAPFATFGAPGENVLRAGGSFVFDPEAAATERVLAPVEVLTVPDPRPVVRAASGPPIVVAGDGFGIVSLARHGLLAADRPILYAATLTPRDLSELVDRGATLVVTDSNRRRVWSFAGVRRNYSHTLPVGDDQVGSTGFGLFDDDPQHQSIAEYGDAVSITSSPYGGLFEQQPEYRPAAAFDGNPASVWLTGIRREPVGSWLQVTFREPREVDGLSIQVPVFTSKLRAAAVSLEFSDGSSVDRRLQGGLNLIELPPRSTRYVRVRITRVVDAFGSRNGVALSEVGIEGVDVHEAIRVPTDLMDLAARAPDGPDALADAPLAFLFDRSRSELGLHADEEQSLVRRFLTLSLRSFDLAGTARLRRGAGDLAIDLLTLGATDVTVASSGRLTGDPRFRGSMALDGRPETAWVANGASGEYLDISFPEQRVGPFSVRTEVGDGRATVTGMTATFGDGSTAVGAVKDDGEVVFSITPRVVSGVRLEVTQTFEEAVDGPIGTVAISEVEIPGVALPAVEDDAALPCAPNADFTIDGRPILVRPEGTVGQLLDGEELPLVTCRPGSILIGSGWHELAARGVLQPDTVMMTSEGARPPAAAVEAPTMVTRTTARGGFDIEVRDATGPFYLVIGQNWHPGWRASIAGASLGRPLVVDGYSAGWLIDRPGSYSVQVRFLPQSRYLRALAVSGVFVLVCLSLVAIHLVGRRRTGRSRS